jgi:hypothetical protein
MAYSRKKKAKRMISVNPRRVKLFLEKMEK